MLFSGPLSGRISTRHGSRRPLMLGTIAAGIAYFSLAALHAEPWQILVGSAILGLGIGLSFAAMANLVVDAVPQEMTGVASGVNTIVRSIGGAIGGQVAAAILTASAGTSGGLARRERLHRRVPDERLRRDHRARRRRGSSRGAAPRSIETTLDADELAAFDEAAVFARRLRRQ